MKYIFSVNPFIKRYIRNQEWGRYGRWRLLARMRRSERVWCALYAVMWFLVLLVALMR